MQLTELQLNRQLYKTQPQTVETLGASDVAANTAPPPSTAIASGNSVTDINTNAETINGGQITPGTIPQQTLDIANWGWTQTCAFTVTDSDTVAWGSGTFTSSDGTSIYSIGAGNTGNMAAKTYVYLDINVSTTAYQVSTSQTAPIGIGKVLIAVCQNGAGTATYILVQATQIVADNIIANTVSAEKMNVAILSAITANMGDLTAGTITLNSSGNIKSGQTAYDTGTGWWLGYSSGAKFSLGNSSGNKMTWDGSSLAVVGSISGAASGARVVITGTLAQFFNSSGTEIVDTYASGSSYLIAGQQSNSSIVLNAGTSGSIIFQSNGTSIVYIDSNGMYPPSSSTYDLGNTSFKWKDIWNTGVQVYQGINQPVVYFGYCSGTTISTTNAGSFTLTNPSTGKYTITHNFGTTNYTVVATTLKGSGAGDHVCKIEARGSNTFQVTTFTANDGVVSNSDFMFNLTKIT